MDDSQRVMGGMPTRAELKTRRARATNAPVAFSINEKTERLEARDIDGALTEVPMGEDPVVVEPPVSGSPNFVVAGFFWKARFD